MKRRFIALSAALAMIPLAACDIDQTEEGELPDVEVEEGALPEYDVDGPEIEVGSETDTLIVDRPTVDVEGPEEDDTIGG